MKTLKQSVPALSLALSLTLPLAPAVHAQDTGGIAPPQSHKGAIIKGIAPVSHTLLNVKLPRPQQFTLSNGVRVFVLEDHRLPVVRYSLTMKAGTLYDPKPGTADLTATMLTEGTDTRSAAQIAAQSADVGANIAADAGKELTTVSISGASDSATVLIGQMADVLLHPSFPQNRLTRVKSRAIALLAQQQSDPSTLAAQETARVFYGDTPYGRVIPQPAEVTALTRDDLAAFHTQFYVPNGAVLGIVGDVNGKQIVAQFEQALKGWTPAAGEAPLPPGTFSPKAATHIFLVDRPASAQTVLSFGNLAITRTDPDYIPLTVANRILGGGASGRLFQNLREDKGYTYGAYSSLAAPKWPGIWGASASVRTPVTEPAVGEFFAEFRRLDETSVTPDEMDRAKRALVGTFALTLESPDGVLARTLELVNAGLPLDYWDQYPARIQAVTAADVQHEAQKYLRADTVQLIAVGERAQIETGLAKYGPVTVVSPGTAEAAR